MGFAPKDYVGSICEVRGQGGGMITTGMIEEFTDRFIKIGKTSHEVSNTMKGMIVKINVINATMGQRYLSGSILVAPKTFMLVTAIQMLEAPERRAYFRIPVNMLTFAEVAKKQYKITIMDISLGGLAFSCPHKFEEDTVLTVNVDMNKQTIPFNCRVRRTSSFPGQLYKHGCEFFDNTERNQDHLCSYIFKQELLLKRTGGDRS